MRARARGERSPDSRGVILVAVVLTIVALLENTIAPWAPFFGVYVALAFLVPIVRKSYRFGPIRAVRWWAWLLAIAGAVLLQAAAGALMSAAFAAGLRALGVADARIDTPYYSVGLALPAMLQLAAERLGAAPSSVMLGYIAFIFVWAGLGEELLYRGYLFGGLRASHGFGAAALVSSLFFGVRHALQLALLWPEYPWPAAACWAAFSFALGLFFCFLYERTRSLYLPVVVHYLFNLIPFLGIVLAPAPDALA